MVLVPNYGVVGANTGRELLGRKRHTNAFIQHDSIMHRLFEASGGDKRAIGMPQHYELVPGFDVEGNKVLALYAENTAFEVLPGDAPYRQLSIKDLS